MYASFGSFEGRPVQDTRALRKAEETKAAKEQQMASFEAMKRQQDLIRREARCLSAFFPKAISPKIRYFPQGEKSLGSTWWLVERGSV